MKRDDDFFRDHAAWHERQRARLLLLRVVLACALLLTAAEVLIRWFRQGV